ncbi:ABC transporter ATP-binding protein [Streptococcus loxodontisalivarius]|uniref:ABC transporter ATP-binding protein n=1 Tax=Streptococcus loxodontisalivarius TaxID=1349415 RepID=UPI0030B80C52
MTLNISKSDGIIGLIGPNGAGKTTLIHSILKITHYNNGYIENYDTKIAYCPDTPEFPDDLNAIEVLYYSAWISGLPKPKEQSISNLLSMVGLSEYKNNKASSFSRGMKQRLGIASSLVLNPELLFLDEPTSALDPFGREEILDIIKKISKKTTVVISTHNLTEVQEIANKLIVINKGRLLYTGDLTDFLGKEELSSIELYNVKGLKQFIEVFKKNNIKLFESKSSDDKVLMFPHSDFPKVLSLIDEKLSPYVKSCNDRKLNLYDAFYRIVNKNEETVHD